MLETSKNFKYSSKYPQWMFYRYTAAFFIIRIMEIIDSEKIDSENFKDITTFAFNKSKWGQSAGNQRLYI
jgi:hypothetical protein